MNKFLTALLCVALVLLTLCVSIALPIYVRPFYYLQIEELNLPEATGYSKEEIKTAYDEVLDYLTLPNRTFGTGLFPHSEEGAAHFADCKVLFRFHAWVLLLSLGTVLVLGVLKGKKGFVPCRPFGKHYLFSCGLGTLVFMGLIGGLAALDFEKAFVIFHSLFFPGKTNWIFNPRKDPIIYAMPETFFLRCGVLILVSVLSISAGLCIAGLVFGKKKSDQ